MTMTVKRRDFQKIAALIHEFLLKLDEEAECAEVRDALNYALLQLQRYFRTLRNRNVIDRTASNNGLGLLGQSIRGMSPMTPFKDAPDMFVWRWVDVQMNKNKTSNSRVVGTTLPARLDKEGDAVPPVIRATRQSDNTLLSQICDRDPNCVNEMDGLGRTAVMYAVQFANLDSLQLLLEQYADINALAEDGTTAVHRACCNGNHEALRMLVQYDADVSVQDNQGRAPIHWAAIAATTDCLEVLLNKGVNVDVRDRDGLSPMMWACRWDRIENFNLLSKHAEMDRKSSKRRQKPLGNVDENGFERDETGRTYFHWAVRRVEPLECLSTLLNETTAELEDSNGKTVMHVAAEQGSLPAVKVVLEIAGKQCLEQRDKNYRTPLILATISGHGEVVNFLLSQGADYTCVDNLGNSAWDYARVRQMHYCLLIIASYIRQRTKNQTSETTGRSSTYPNGGGITSRMLDYEDFGINHLQIKGEEGTSTVDLNGSVPRPPPMPPATPRAPRASRQNGHVSSKPSDSVTPAINNSYNRLVTNGPPSSSRVPSNKRSPTTPVEDSDYANGYLADYEKETPRVGSASKRLRGADNESSNGTAARRREGRTDAKLTRQQGLRSGEVMEIDDHGEQLMGGDTMGVSDFDDEDDDDDDEYAEVLGSPTAPVQPVIEHHQRTNSGRAGMGSFQPDTNDNAAYPAERPPSRTKKQSPLTAIPKHSSKERKRGSVDYHNTGNGGAWADSNPGAENGAAKDYYRPSSRQSILSKSPPPHHHALDVRTAAVLPTPPSYLVPLPAGAPLKKKKKKKLQASMLGAESQSLMPLNAVPLGGGDMHRQKQPSPSLRSRSKPESSLDREPRKQSLDSARSPSRPDSRASNSDQWTRVHHSSIIAGSDDVHSDDDEDSYSISESPQAPNNRVYTKGSKYSGSLYTNGPAAQLVKPEGPRVTFQQQAYHNAGAPLSAAASPVARDSHRRNTPVRPSITADPPWLVRKPPLSNGSITPQRRH